MLWTFDDCMLDVERRELRRAGIPVAVEPQVFDLLVYLLRNRARVVTKDDLLQAVWQGADRLRLRRWRIASTRRGLRLATVGRVNLLFVRCQGRAFVSSAMSPRRGTHSVRAQPGMASPLSLPEQPSLVVLPFTDISPDPQHSHLADGITEDLTTELARIRWLFVIARNFAFAYRNRPVDVKQISHELGVRYVLEGSVRRSGQRIRITAQLIDATTGVHQWAERYDRDAGEIFAVQDEIARSVAAAVEPHLLAAEGRRAAFLSPADLGAWELVARAQSPSSGGSRNLTTTVLLRV